MRILGCLLLALLLTACGASDDGEPRPKSEDEIIADVEQSDKFWFAISPGSGDEYSLTDFSLILRETIPEESDFIAAEITAQSEYATCTGHFEIKYQYSAKDESYILSLVLPTSIEYSDIQLPNDATVVEAWEGLLLSEGAISIQDAYVEAVPKNERLCKLVAVYTKSDSTAHSFSEITASYVVPFEGGTWNFSNGSFKILNEITTYDPANEVYWEYDYTVNGIRLINAYEENNQQFCDEFIYYCKADLNYENIIEYGFLSTETRIPVTDRYAGHTDQQTVIDGSNGFNQ